MLATIINLRSWAAVGQLFSWTFAVSSLFVLFIALKEWWYEENEESFAPWIPASLITLLFGFVGLVVEWFVTPDSRWQRPSRWLITAAAFLFFVDTLLPIFLGLCATLGWAYGLQKLVDTGPPTANKP